MCVCFPPGFDTRAFEGLRVLGPKSKEVEERKEVSGVLSSSCVAAPNPFEEQENVDARFVEETALKQTLILLGFEGK